LGQQTVEQLKIFHFGVNQGDCTLIMVRAQDNFKAWHTISILIDTGLGRGNHTAFFWDEIWGVITAEGGKQLDYFIISHLDQDHYGVAAGILDLLITRKYAWIERMYLIDRMAIGQFVLPKGYRTKPFKRPPSKEFPTYDTARKNYGLQTRPLLAGQDLFKRLFATYELPNFQMLCVASNGTINGEIRAKFKEKTPKEPEEVAEEENDLSFGFLLRFGSFRFYTGGDLHGTHGKPVPVKDRKDSMEVSLVDYLNDAWKDPKKTRIPQHTFHTCALLLHHHGSRFSTMGDFIDYFNPRIAVCSAGVLTFNNQRFPRPEVIARLRGDDPLPLAGLTPPPPKYFPKNACTLLFTFRITTKGGSEEPTLSNQKVDQWRHKVDQDVILHVINEPGQPGQQSHSPLVDGDKPKIYMYRRRRDPQFRRLESPVPYETREFQKTGIAICDRNHENLPLP
jgi:hypothetical protein